MRYVIGLSFAALAVWVLQATGIFMGLMMFLMIGTVPGTHISVPPLYMMLLLTAVTIGTLYWLFRQRPVRQIQEMKRAYTEQTEQEAVIESRTIYKKESFFGAGYRESFASTRASAQRRKYRTLASVARTMYRSRSGAAKFFEPIRALTLALAIITGIATHELTSWSRPHVRRALAWIRLQIGYSVKGTMLSAHRWSSLNRKLFSSLTSLLKRSNSALKRGKSLLTRSAR